MKNNAKLQYWLTALLFIILMSAKAQTYYPVAYCGATPMDWQKVVYVDNKNQTIHLEGVDMIPIFDNTYLEHIVNGVAIIIPLGGSLKLWHVSSYLGKYRIRTRTNGYSGQIIYELQFYIKKNN